MMKLTHYFKDLTRIMIFDNNLWVLDNAPVELQNLLAKVPGPGTYKISPAGRSVTRVDDVRDYWYGMIETLVSTNQSYFSELESTNYVTSLTNGSGRVWNVHQINLDNDLKSETRFPEVALPCLSGNYVYSIEDTERYKDRDSHIVWCHAITASGERVFVGKIMAPEVSRLLQVDLAA